jgi:hypothetical protein
MAKGSSAKKAQITPIDEEMMARQGQVIQEAVEARNVQVVIDTIVDKEPLDETILEDEESLPVSDTPILYDVRIPQKIKIDLFKNGKFLPVYHNFKEFGGPEADARWFQFLAETEDIAAKSKRASTDMYKAHCSLWSDLVESREGYKERDDWKKVTHQSDQIAAIAALLTVFIVPENEIEADTDEVLYDEDALTKVSFRTVFNSAFLGEMSHSFAQESKAQMDEFLAIQAGLSNAVASAEKATSEERLCRIGRKLLKDSAGYADGSDIPAWHLAKTTETFLNRQVERMGKSLNP